jgi:hypothetical protein
MIDANQWSGIAKGFSATPGAIKESKMKDAQLATAQSRQQMAEMQLEEYSASAPTRAKADEVQMQKLEMDSYNTNTQLTKQQTYDSFNRFKADNDVRHLNTFLADVKGNPVGAKLYGDVVRMDPLTRTTENDAILRGLGYTDLDAVYNDPALSKDLLSVTGTNKYGIININDMYASTGYTKYLDNEQLKDMERKARMNQMLRSGMSGNKAQMQERVMQSLIDSGKAKTVDEAYKMLNEMESGGGAGVNSSAEERSVRQIMEDENLTYLESLDKYYATKRQGGGGTNESRFVDEYMQENPGATRTEASGEYRNLTKTSTQKEVGDVRELRKGLDKQKWLETDVSTMTSQGRARVYRDFISPLEDLRDFKLTTDDKRTIRSMRDLTALGKTAGEELTPDETGLIDNALGGFKKYTYDELGGTKAKAAYHTFSNLLRNALYGASLTKAEIAAFNKSAGNLGQQFLPVLSQFKTQVGRIKSNLESIRDLNDPDIAHYYLGMPIEDVDNVIANLDARLADPRLRAGRGKKPAGQSIQVRRGARQTPATPPDVNSTEKDPGFNFDDAMQKAGL